MALIGDTTGLSTFALTPEQSGYSLTMADGTTISDISGGLAVKRLQFINAPAEVSCTYVCVSQAAVQYAKGFFRQNMAFKFIANLAIDSYVVEPYVCQLVGTPQWEETGFNGRVKVKLQVQPAPDRCYEQFLIDFYPCWGENIGCIIRDVHDSVLIIEGIDWSK